MTTTTTPHTTASGAADLHGMLRSAANNIAYAMDNLAGMTLAELPQGMLDSTGAAESGLLAERTIREVMGLLAASAPVAPTQPASITLDFKQATELLGMYGGEPTEVTLMVGNGHSGKGVYAHWTSVPEEGAMFLGASDDEAAPVAPAPQPAHLDLDRVLSIADVHAEESREDGVRLMDRGGLNAFASDIIRVSQGQPEAPSQSAQIVELATQLRKDALTIFDDDVHDVIEWFYGSLLAAASKADHIPEAGEKVAPLQQGEYLPLAVASAPERIYLDLGFDPKESDANFADLNTPTWSADNASGHGIEYVRADRAARGAAQAAPAPVAEDADPLQGAANWLIGSGTVTDDIDLARRLSIGYNRAERLLDAARAQAAQPEGGAK